MYPYDVQKQEGRSLHRRHNGKAADGVQFMLKLVAVLFASTHDRLSVNQSASYKWDENVMNNVRGGLFSIIYNSQMKGMCAMDNAAFQL